MLRRTKTGECDEHHCDVVLQVVAGDVESFRSKVNEAVAVIDNLDAHKQTWLEQTSCLKARTARFAFLLLCYV